MADNEVNNKQIIFKHYITGMPKESDMILKSTKLALQLKSGSQDILVKNLYLSIDPYLRGRMRDDPSYFVPSFKPGSVMNGWGIAKVVLSNDPYLKVDDLLMGFTGWEEYSVIPAGHNLVKIKCTDVPLSYYLGVLGMPGHTAYIGIHRLSSPKEGESVFVSAASGAVGQFVGQFAKLSGCHVVGSVGSKEKVELLKNKLGFDDAFNYKEEPDLKAALKRYFPKGIDIYFENVGGEMLEAVLENMNVHGRIAVCGMISQYNQEGGKWIKNAIQLLIKCIKFEGFLEPDYSATYPEFVEKARDHLKEGKIICLEDIAEGLESAPSAFVGLFQGKNIGKQLVRICAE